MKVRYQNKIYEYPSSAHDVTLGALIGYHHAYGKTLQEQLDEINQLEDESQKEEAISLHLLDTYAKSFAYHTGIPLDEVRRNIDIGELHDIYYSSLQKSLEQTPVGYPIETTWDGSTWVIGQSELRPDDNRILDEFLTAKEAMRQLQSIGASSWEKLLYLCAVYFRKQGEQFSESLMSENSKRMELLKKLPAFMAMQVGLFFDQHCHFLKENFSVFNKSASGTGIDMSALFDRWGWVSFLSAIAKDGVFTVSGMNAIDSAKQSKLYDVLVYASEKKDMEEIIAAHYKSQSKKT